MTKREKATLRQRAYEARQPKGVCECGKLIHRRSKRCVSCSGKLGAKARWG